MPAGFGKFVISGNRGPIKRDHFNSVNGLNTLESPANETNCVYSDTVFC